MRRYLLIQVVLLFNTIFCFAQNNAITFSLQANGQFVSSQGENNIIIKTSADSCKLYKNLVSACFLYGVLNPNQVVATDGENINMTPMTIWTPNAIWGDGHDRALLFNVRIKIVNGGITIYGPLFISMAHSSNMNVSYIDAENMALYWGLYDKNGNVKKAERLQYINDAVNKKLTQIIDMALQHD